MTAPFEPRVALASLSGAADATWARAAAEDAGCAFLGGIALDEPTREAARAMVERDREEFLPAEPLSFIDSQLAALRAVPIQAGFNVRAAGSEPVAEAATVCADHDAIVEINAHCRQQEMCSVGAGQSLMCDPDRLCEQVRAAAQTGATVSVKLRTEVDGVDLPAVATQAAASGAAMVHVDAMDSEHRIRDVAAETDAWVIANNGVRDRETVHEYLEFGADAVSIGRPSDDPAVRSRVSKATDEWFAQANGAGQL